MDRRTFVESLGFGAGGFLLWNITLGAQIGTGEPDFGPATRPVTTDTRFAEVVRGNQAFGFDLYRRLASAHSTADLVVSPLSVSVALAMTWAGAREDTEQAMASALHLPTDQAAAHPAVGALQYDLHRDLQNATDRDLLNWDGDQVAFTLANSLWGLPKYPYRDEFLDLLEEYYGAGIYQVDFAADPEGARERINDWVARETHGQIPSLYPAGGLDAHTRLVLANAAYFHGPWHQPFDPENTRIEEFTGLDGTTDRVRMMHHEDRVFLLFSHYEGHRLVELPYVGKTFSFVAVLPAEGEFETLEQTLDPSLLDSLFANQVEREMGLGLPRFTLTTDHVLNESLSAMGMAEAFRPGAANFEGIAPIEETGEPLYLDEVRHEATIRVEERGTEAAAATGTQLRAISALPGSVVFDRPFLYFIRHRPTDAIVFLGRVVNPPDGR